MKSNGTLFLAALYCFTNPAWAEDISKEKSSVFHFGGLAFGDVYHVPSHHSEQGDGATGAVLRRLYLTLDADISDECSGRMRLETNQDGDFEVYEFETDFKDLHVACDIGQHRLTVGLAPTITYDLIEKIWGARYLMRTPMDLQGVPSRDTGVSIKGPINASGTWSYRAMYGWGNEFGSDSSDTSKWMAALTWKPSDPWTVDFYADFEPGDGPTDRSTLQAFVGYQTSQFRWGAQYSNQDRQSEPDLELASVFAAGSLGQKTEWLARIDHLLEPSPRGDGIDYLPFDPTARATLLVAALETEAAGNFFVTPNVVYVNYDKNDEGITPKSDLYLRLTLFFKF